MSSNSVNYEVVPITSKCDQEMIESNVIIQPTPGGTTSDTLNDLNHQQNQMNENMRYDTIQSGGKKINKLNKVKEFNLKILNKKYKVQGYNEMHAIYNFLKNKKYSRNHILTIGKNLYLIKNKK